MTNPGKITTISLAPPYNRCYIFRGEEGPRATVESGPGGTPHPPEHGNIARTCAATGARLHLVEPLGFSIDSAKLRRAGLDYWDYLDITRYPSLEDFLDRARGEELFFFTTKEIGRASCRERV